MTNGLLTPSWAEDQSLRQGRTLDLDMADFDVEHNFNYTMQESFDVIEEPSSVKEVHQLQKRPGFDPQFRQAFRKSRRRNQNTVKQSWKFPRRNPGRSCVLSESVNPSRSQTSGPPLKTSLVDSGPPID